MILVRVVHEPGFDSSRLQGTKQLERLPYRHPQITLAMNNQAGSVESIGEQMRSYFLIDFGIFPIGAETLIMHGEVGRRLRIHIVDGSVDHQGVERMVAAEQYR